MSRRKDKDVRYEDEGGGGVDKDVRYEDEEGGGGWIRMSDTRMRRREGER